MPANTPNPYLEQSLKIEAALRQISEDHPLRELLADSARLLADATEGTCHNASRDKTRAALIDKGYHWQEITPQTSKGAKMQLINRKAGVAVYGTIGSNEKYFTHWAPLPTFND